MQEFIEGNPFSAQFFCVDNAPELVGVTEQLIGEPWLHAAPFRYAGNIGPVFFDGPVEQSLEKLAAAVTQAVGLEGPWGFDFILRDGTAYLLEVNPRYTAAMEVIELATHSEFFGVPVPSPPSATIGKAIYFAPHRIVFPASGSWDMDLAGEFDPWRIPDFADIPEPGEVIEPGWPVLTFFEQGSSSADVRGQLQSRAAELDRRFAESRS
jgi:predicted ATP-grasp superfamily ATP-dependent carboligase